PQSWTFATERPPWFPRDAHARLQSSRQSDQGIARPARRSSAAWQVHHLGRRAHWQQCDEGRALTHAPEAYMSHSQPPGEERSGLPARLPEGYRIAGRYVIRRFVALGATTRVYAAEDASTGQPVAVKVVRYDTGMPNT